LLIKYLYDLSLRELEVRLYTDKLARWFSGYQLFDDLPGLLAPPASYMHGSQPFWSIAQ
jgi:Transposase domain (DUF772)